MSDAHKLETKVADLEKQVAEYRRLYLEMMERCRKLELGLHASKSEHLPPSDGQLALSVLGLVLDDKAKSDLDQALAEVDADQHVDEHVRRKPTGRKPISDELPRIVVELIPLEVQYEGLDAFERIGEEVSETIERRHASVVVMRTVRPKFVRKDRDRKAPTTVLIAEPPELPIPRGLAGPGMLADTVVQRWQDHIPLHRMENIYARDGLDLARSTICGWHFELKELVEPLVAAMRQDALQQPFVCTDATGVLVQHPEKCRTGHFWVLVAPGRHVLFEYTREHTSDAVDEVLAGYQGYVVADAHAVYDHLYKSGDLVEVNCWAHARRYFFKALGSDPPRAKVALDLIGALFRIERSIADAPRKKREKIRDKRSRPIVESFLSWCDAEASKVLDDTPISDGIRYARNQRVGLARFLDDGRLPLHNNMSELELRRQAIGRKNWLFVGNDEGGAVNAAFTSLLASCALHGIEPWAYLRDVFCLLPRWPEHRVLELSPLAWSATCAREDVRAALEANPFRHLTLG